MREQNFHVLLFFVAVCWFCIRVEGIIEVAIVFLSRFGVNPYDFQDKYVDNNLTKKSQTAVIII